MWQHLTVRGATRQTTQRFGGHVATSYCQGRHQTNHTRVRRSCGNNSLSGAPPDTAHKGSAVMWQHLTVRGATRHSTLRFGSHVATSHCNGATRHSTQGFGGHEATSHCEWRHQTQHTRVRRSCGNISLSGAPPDTAHFGSAVMWQHLTVRGATRHSTQGFGSHVATSHCEGRHQTNHTKVRRSCGNILLSGAPPDKPHKGSAVMW